MLNSIFTKTIYDMRLSLFLWSLTLVLLSQALSSNTDAVLEGISRAVSTSLNTDWSQAAEG